MQQHPITVISNTFHEYFQNSTNHNVIAGRITEKRFILLFLLSNLPVSYLKHIQSKVKSPIQREIARILNTPTVPLYGANVKNVQIIRPVGPGSIPITYPHGQAMYVMGRPGLGKSLVVKSIISELKLDSIEQSLAMIHEQCQSHTMTGSLRSYYNAHHNVDYLYINAYHEDFSLQASLIQTIASHINERTKLNQQLAKYADATTRSKKLDRPLAEQNDRSTNTGRHAQPQSRSKQPPRHQQQQVTSSTPHQDHLISHKWSWGTLRSLLVGHDNYTQHKDGGVYGKPWMTFHPPTEQPPDTKSQHHPGGSGSHPHGPSGNRYGDDDDDDGDPFSSVSMTAANPQGPNITFTAPPPGTQQQPTPSAPPPSAPPPSAEPPSPNDTFLKFILDRANSDKLGEHYGVSFLPTTSFILIIDEFDRLSPAVSKELIQLCYAPHSRMSLIGIGNTIGFINDILYDDDRSQRYMETSPSAPPPKPLAIPNHTFQPSILPFNHYNFDGLARILNTRLSFCIKEMMMLVVRRWVDSVQSSSSVDNITISHPLKRPKTVMNPALLKNGGEANGQDVVLLAPTLHHTTATPPPTTEAAHRGMETIAARERHDGEAGVKVLQQDACGDSDVEEAHQHKGDTDSSDEGDEEDYEEDEDETEDDEDGETEDDEDGEAEDDDEAEEDSFDTIARSTPAPAPSTIRRSQRIREHQEQQQARIEQEREAALAAEKHQQTPKPKSGDGKSTKRKHKAAPPTKPTTDSGLASHAPPGISLQDSDAANDIYTMDGAASMDSETTLEDHAKYELYDLFNAQDVILLQQFSRLLYSQTPLAPKVLVSSSSTPPLSPEALTLAKVSSTIDEIHRTITKPDAVSFCARKVAMTALSDARILLGVFDQVLSDAMFYTDHSIIFTLLINITKSLGIPVLPVQFIASLFAESPPLPSIVASPVGVQSKQTPLPSSHTQIGLSRPPQSPKVSAALPKAPPGTPPRAVKRAIMIPTTPTPRTPRTPVISTPTLRFSPTLPLRRGRRDGGSEFPDHINDSLTLRGISAFASQAHPVAQKQPIATSTQPAPAHRDPTETYSDTHTPPPTTVGDQVVKYLSSLTPHTPLLTIQSFVKNRSIDTHINTSSIEKIRSLTSPQRRVLCAIVALIILMNHDTSIPFTIFNNTWRQTLTNLKIPPPPHDTPIIDYLNSIETMGMIKLIHNHRKHEITIQQSVSSSIVFQSLQDEPLFAKAIKKLNQIQEARKK